MLNLTTAGDGGLWAMVRSPTGLLLNYGPENWRECLIVRNQANQLPLTCKADRVHTTACELQISNPWRDLGFDDSQELTDTDVG